MKYINVSGARVLVGINRIKQWVAPGQVVELSSVDARMLGSSAIYVKPLPLNTEPVFEKEATKPDNVTSEEISGNVTSEEISGGETQTVVTKKQLNDALSGLTKARLVEVATAAGFDVRQKDRNDVLVNIILKEAKTVGYNVVFNLI